MKTLQQIVSERPFPEFGDWWPMGPEFLGFMADAIGSAWRSLRPNPPQIGQVQGFVNEYVEVVYGRPARPRLAQEFLERAGELGIESGEFDALSYGFYRSAFEWIEANHWRLNGTTAQARRGFAVRVGERFYEQLHAHLGLDLPDGLTTQADFEQLQATIDRVGGFLSAQGYLRDHFAFRFDVHLEHGGQTIAQEPGEVVSRLAEAGLVHALYKMGYPVILPSAVYLFHTLGEAQHHSSRTIEELFDRVGLQAAETDDFDPIGYPSEMVVELWEIRRGA